MPKASRCYFPKVTGLVRGQVKIKHQEDLATPYSNFTLIFSTLQ